MTYQQFFTRASRSLSLTLLTSALSVGAVIYDSGTTSFQATDPTQDGELFISNPAIPSDWSASKPFPGVINASTAFRYEVFNVPVSSFPFLQISIDDTPGTSGEANAFASAYLNSYTPSTTGTTRGLDINYLGDEGRVGNPFKSNPAFFQIVLPSAEANHLVVVVNQRSELASLSDNKFRILVEGFYDTAYNDTVPPAPTVPEPATITLSGAGFALAVVAAYRRKQNR